MVVGGVIVGWTGGAVPRSKSKIGRKVDEIVREMTADKIIG